MNSRARETFRCHICPNISLVLKSSIIFGWRSSRSMWYLRRSGFPYIYPFRFLPESWYGHMYSIWHSPLFPLFCSLPSLIRIVAQNTIDTAGKGKCRGSCDLRFCVLVYMRRWERINIVRWCLKDIIINKNRKKDPNVTNNYYLGNRLSCRVRFFLHHGKSGQADRRKGS